MKVESRTRPVVTIITATFNAASTLRACIDSIRAQDYPNLQHLIIDGGSKDSTVAILQEHATPGSWISEPDHGIYDAWNKGLERARGEWIAFVGADDILLPGAVSAYMKLAEEHPEAIYLSSRTRWLGPHGRTRIIGKSWSWPRFQRTMTTAHVGSMHKRELFERYGRYDISLRIVADYEMLLRAGPMLRTAFMHVITVEMQGGGNSDNAKAIDEAARVKIATGGRAAWLTGLERYESHVRFHVRRHLNNIPPARSRRIAALPLGNNSATDAAMPHVGYLDALRGIAALGVLAVHCAACTLQTAKFSWPFFAGQSGVELFYAVSAFTLFLSMDARARESRATLKFFVRRFFRIAPLFYLAVVLNWFRLRLPSVHGYRPHSWDYLFGFLFLFGFKPTLINSIAMGGWSIAVETTFYAVLPLLHASIRTLRAACVAFCSAYLVLLPFSYWLARRYPENEGYFASIWFPAQLPMFLMGILVFFLVKAANASLATNTRRMLGAAVFVISVSGFFVMNFPPGRFLTSNYPIDIFLIGGILFSFAMNAGALLVNAFTRFVGQVSYSVYLLNIFVLEGLLKLDAVISHNPSAFLGVPLGGGRSLLVFSAVAVSCTLLIATFSWKYVEQPGIAAGRNLLKRLGGSRKPRRSVMSPGVTAGDDMSSAPL